MAKSMDYCKRGPLTKPKGGEVKSETKSNPDGTYTITKSKGDKSASTTYKKENPKDPKSNVYKNEHGQKRSFISTKKSDDPVATKKKAKY